MVNLSKCDDCGNRYIMCSLCNKNEFYRKTNHSYKQVIRYDAIREFAHILFAKAGKDGKIHISCYEVKELAEQLIDKRM